MKYNPEVEKYRYKENNIFKTFNGCQVDTLIEDAKIIIERLNDRYPFHENTVVVGKLYEALAWLDKRKKDREARGVEGTNQK